jgi:lysophospholipase L1-like esterase
MSFRAKSLVLAGILFSAGLFLPIHFINAQTIIVSNPAPAVRADEGPIVNRTALVPFFRRLAAVESGANARPVVIMQFGDSHTKADLFTAEVRRSLQSQFDKRGPVQDAAYRSDAHGAERIIYQPLGVNGARAKKLLEMTASEAFLRSVGQRNPDLIILAYGTNEVTDNDWTVASYERMFTDIVGRLHAAAPAASILIMGPPDRGVNGRSAPRMPSMIEAQQRAAFRSGAAFWSACEAMGGNGSMMAWSARGLTQGDHVHFTVQGYYRLGDLFFGDLMTAYTGIDLRRQPRARVAEEAPRRGLSESDINLMRGGTILTNPRD